jgi:hypothetical protein
MVAVVSGWRALRRTQHPSLKGAANYEFGAHATDWGADWRFLHYRRSRGQRDGWAFLAIPAGLQGTAPDQPLPIILRDRDCSDCDLLMSFRTSNETLRPGALLRAEGMYDFLAMTVEGNRLILSHFRRASRSEVASAPIPSIRSNHRYELALKAQGGAVSGTLSDARGPIGHLQTVVGQQLQRSGAVGILAVHPLDLKPARLDVRQFSARAAGFQATPPFITHTISGPPAAPGSRPEMTLRVGTDLPCQVRFEWADNPEFASYEHSGWLAGSEPPYGARVPIAIPQEGRLYWRAVVRSNSSGRQVTSNVQSIERPDSSKALSLLAGSCVEFYEETPTHAYTRLKLAAPTRPAMMLFQGDMGYANNRFHSCYIVDQDFFADRFIRFLADPLFAALRASVPTGFTLDDHDYGPENNADRTTMEPWVPALWQRIGADPSDLGYFDFGYEDVHCLTLDGRRYADPIDAPNTPTKTKLGAAQKSWLKRTIGTSDANLFVILSADTFASRYTVPNSPNIPDCFISGWPNEYGQLMSFFYDIQSQGRRVLIVSGDAHSLRIHYHPHPQGQPTPSPVVEFICSGIRPRRWFGAAAGDRTLDPIRNVLGRAGAGLVVIDPPAHRDRRVTVRAISGARAGPTDLFPPLILPFSSRLPDAGR